MIRIKIDNKDFYNMPAQKYWSFPKNYQGDKKNKAKELVLSNAYYGATKVDGFWGMILKDNNGKLYMRSRTAGVNGEFQNKIEWIPQIAAELNDVPNNSVLIGELFLPNDEGSRKITSILGCLKEKALERQKENPIHFYIFDILAWRGRSWIKKRFEYRIKDLGKFNEVCVKNKLKYVECAEYKKGRALWNLYKQDMYDGREGIVITKFDAKYEPGKRTAWNTLKMKRELNDTIDCFFTGNYKYGNKDYIGKELDKWTYWYNQRTHSNLPEGNHYKEYVDGNSIIPITKNYYYHYAGSVELGVYKDNKIVPIGYLSGLSEEIRKSIGHEEDKYKMKCCEISAMEIDKIEHDNGAITYGLRHPKFIQFRDDITPQDCRYDKFISETIS